MLSRTGLPLVNQLGSGIKRYWGKYRGIVTNVEDPEYKGRIKARIPRVLGEHDCNWALPCAPFAGDLYGIQFLPEPGDGVWIEFEEGDPNKPLWVGFWWKPENLPVGGYGDYTHQRRFVWVPGDLYIEFNSSSETPQGDSAKAPYIRIRHASGTEIVSEANGNLSLRAKGDPDAEEHLIHLDVENKKINILSAGENQILIDDNAPLIKVVSKDKVVVEAEGDASVSAGGNVGVEAGGSVTVSAGGSATISASSASIDAGSVSIAGGGQPIARVGDLVEVACPTHGSHVGTITQGSGKATCG